MHSIKITAANLSQSVIIDTPCTSDWNEMIGSESVRFCHSCKLNVYNISQFSDREAEEIFAQNLNGNRMCTRLFRRPDGTIMTDNCPRALRRMRDLRNKAFTAFTKITALATLFFSASLTSAAQASENDRAKAAPQPSKSKPETMPAVQPVVSPGYQNSPHTQAIAGVPMMPNLSDYMERLQKKLFKLWREAGNPKAGALGLRPTKVTFTINVNGELSKLKIKESSTQAAQDQEALKAVRLAQPFEAPPQERFPLDIEFSFDPKSMSLNNDKSKLEQQPKEHNDGH